MKVILSVISGPRKGESKEFEEADLFIVGRNQDCHFTVPDDPFLSRHHFMLEVDPPELELQDLGSRNGTFVNGRKIGGRSADETPEEAKQKCRERVELKDGDMVKVGKTEIVVRCPREVLCVECGQGIPEEGRKAAEFVGGTHLCRECRRKADEKQKASAPPPVVAPPPPAAPKAPLFNPGPLVILPVPPVKPPSPPGPAVHGARPAAAPRPAAGPVDDMVMQIIKRDPVKAEQDPGAVIEELLKHLFAARPQEPLPVIKGYRMVKELGRGGFGAVYLAEAEKTGKTVAVKTMLQTRTPDARGLMLFEREIEVTKGLRHNNVVKLEDHGEFQGIHFFVLEFMDGGSVWDLMGQGKRKIPYSEALPMMIQALEGLAYAHKQGIVHRDLKPPNLLISRKDGRMTLKISDLGLAKSFKKAGMTKKNITVTGSFCGSPPYMAPEHITNYRFVKPCTDVFEMAACFYQMLTARVIWDIAGMQDLLAILEGTITPIRCLEDSLPMKFTDVIDRALDRDPARRYRDGGEFLQAMKKIQ